MTAEISSILSGADYVMLGGMLANHDESEGAIVKENDRDFMLFYGMSSSTAIDKHYGGEAQGIKPPNNIHPGDGEGEYHGREGFG